MIWDAVLRLGGQMRWMTGGDRPVAMGWDMAAALALATALGIPARLAAEMLPPIEAAATRAMNAPDGALDFTDEDAGDD